MAHFLDLKYLDRIAARVEKQYSWEHQRAQAERLRYLSNDHWVDVLVRYRTLNGYFAEHAPELIALQQSPPPYTTQQYHYGKGIPWVPEM